MQAGRPTSAYVTEEATEIYGKVSVGQVWIAFVERVTKLGSELQLIPVFKRQATYILLWCNCTTVTSLRKKK